MQSVAYTGATGMQAGCVHTIAMPVQPVHTQHAATQPTATLARPVYAPSMPMHTMTECTPESAVPVAEGLPVVTQPAVPVYECAPTLPTSATPAHAVHECTPAMSLHPIYDCVPAASRPAMPVCECMPAMPRPAVLVDSPYTSTALRSATSIIDCTPTVSASTVCTHTVSATSAATVHTLSQPEPTLSEVKPTTSFVVHPSAPPAPTVTQPQVVLIKQFQQPKPYSGSSSWKGYREYFERLAAVNGWSTPEQKVEQLALALEGPATEVLRDLDTSHPQAYNIIWDALARRFGSLDGAREAMRRFDSRRQEDSETIPDFEQALRSLHREAWPTATPEQRDAALKRRFEDGLLSSDMVQFVFEVTCP